ncbi:MAG: hypothetical protein HRT52_10995 [Colwellia sp.]|nr:hypothetical protein [Colwellia sp.]
MKLLFLTLYLLLSTSADADITDNLRWSLDASARINVNNATNNTSGIYALGLDTHKVFTGPTGDIGYTVAQLYFTKLSNHTPFPWMFDSKNDSEFIIREAHVNYTAGPSWLPNIRLGHFTFPFGLEESIDTNGRLLDYHHGKNLGAKLDWGLGLNKVLKHLEYSMSYTLGGKDKPQSINNSYALSGRIGSLSFHDFVIGFSFFDGEIDNIKRKKVAIDWQYYWGTWGILGEIALGKDNKQKYQWQKEKTALLELNKTSINERLKLYTQYVFLDRELEIAPQRLINMGLSYQLNSKLEVSMSARKQLTTPKSAEKEALFRLQLRLRY